MCVYVRVCLRVCLRMCVCLRACACVRVCMCVAYKPTGPLNYIGVKLICVKPC